MSDVKQQCGVPNGFDLYIDVYISLSHQLRVLGPQ